MEESKHFTIGNFRYYITSDDETHTVQVSLNKETIHDVALIKKIFIPEFVIKDGIKYSVTSIAYVAFEHCLALTSVTIPDSVTNIEASAFFNCI